MPCYQPKEAVRVHFNASWNWTKNGKYKVYFGKEAESMIRGFGEYTEVLKIPCNSCVGCMNRRTSDWALRCYHESMYWSSTTMITLTYESGYLPPNRSLDKSDLQKFWKRFRQELRRKYGINSIRYFACGEYGEERGRPHYHAVVFGFGFPDKIEVSNNPGAVNRLWESAMLTKIWGMGKCTLSVLGANGAAANYISKYVTKKSYGAKGDKEYAGTGRIPPFSCMSQGIGDSWYEDYRSDLYPHSYCVSEDGSTKLPVPKRYDRKLAEEYPEYWEWIKEQRNLNRKDTSQNETLERLEVRHELAKLRSQECSRRRLDRKQAFRGQK